MSKIQSMVWFFCVFSHICIHNWPNVRTCLHRFWKLWHFILVFAILFVYSCLRLVNYVDFSILWSTSYALCMTSITPYFVSCCFYINAMWDHFNVVLNSVQINIERMKTENNVRKVKKIHKAQMCNLIEFHMKIYEWVWKTFSFNL